LFSFAETPLSICITCTGLLLARIFIYLKEGVEKFLVGASGTTQ
jgi:hypothetical protein